MAEEVITTREGSLGIVRMYRPESLNTLNLATMRRLADAFLELDAAGDVRCLLLLGGERAFSTGLDLREVTDLSMVEIQQRDPFAAWDRVARRRKPIVAAVNGYALGSGCELALLCDIVVAGEDARFGFPQINLGIIPGAGGTQRLMRLVGPALASDLILTGRTLTANEAARAGLVSRVVPRENCEAVAREIAGAIAERAPLAVRAAREVLRRAHELSLEEGLAVERRACYMLFGTDDQKEGMRAYLEKRAPIFAGR